MDISKELWLKTVQKWHPENKLRGYYPACGYCEERKSEDTTCIDCAMQAAGVCGNGNPPNKNLFYQFYVVFGPLASQYADQILAIVMADGVRLGYAKSVVAVPEWGNLLSLAEIRRLKGLEREG